MFAKFYGMSMSFGSVAGDLLAGFYIFFCGTFVKTCKREESGKESRLPAGPDRNPDLPDRSNIVCG